MDSFTISEDNRDAVQTPEYLTQMEAKANSGLSVPIDPSKPGSEGKVEGGGPDENTPTLLAGKYKSEDDLNKGILEALKKQYGGNLEDAYKSLEKGVHGKKADEAATPNDSGDNTLAPIKDEAEARTLLESKGLDFDKYAQEFVSNKTISEESFAELEAKGIPRTVAEQYVEGLKLQGEKIAGEMFGLVGGKDQYFTMVEWAKEGLSPDEKKAFNDAISTNNPAYIKTAVRALKSAYQDSNPSKPKFLSGGTVGNVQGYESWAQVKADMSKPEYTKDPAFRKKVQDRLSNSKI